MRGGEGDYSGGAGGVLKVRQGGGGVDGSGVLGVQAEAVPWWLWRGSCGGRCWLR